MPSPSLFALLDDITTVLDDVALLTKVATKKTAGVLGDDLALNAEQVSGVNAERELPVVWAVAKGSLVNKAILVPAALAISALIPWAILPLLVVGGSFLCFEGSEKIVHKLFHKEEQHEEHEQVIQAAANQAVDLVAFERDKIKGAIRTDFVLSAEIVVIALGTVAGAPLSTRVVVLVGIGLLLTAGVYGFVAAIVKLDDLGLHLALRSRRGGPFAALQRGLARAILLLAPWLMKALSVAGTIAMFLVGGGILTHALAPLHHFVEHRAAALRSGGGAAAWLAAVLPTLVNLVVGVIAGCLVLALWSGLKRLRAAKPASG